VPLFPCLGWASYALIMRPVVHTSHNVQVFTTVGSPSCCRTSRSCSGPPTRASCARATTRP
jgi:hypothetical protein